MASSSSPARRTAGSLATTARRGLRQAARGVRAGVAAARTEPASHKSTRKRRDPDRLVQSPVFVICGTRSGSTLLRVLLDSHSRICAPHEMHLGDITCKPGHKHTVRSLEQLGLDGDDLGNLLWDRVLHRELLRSGKSIIVDKTPQNVFRRQRIAAMWPNARYLFLLRHPVSIARSVADKEHGQPTPAQLARLNEYGTAIEAARAELTGPTVRYEELTADPAGVLTRLCDWLGVTFEPGMLDYGSSDHGNFRGGIGDWSKNIRSGQVQPAKPLPDPSEVPAELTDLCRAWGYL